MINPLFISLRLLDVIDILLVAVLLYQLYNLVKGTITIRILAGIVVVLVIWKTVEVLQMELVANILGQFIGMGAIAVIIIFQPELRKFLVRLGNHQFLRKATRGSFFNFSSMEATDELDHAEMSRAIWNLSARKTGALIVFTQRNDLSNYESTGIKLNSDFSVELIESIFYKNNPLHDGAVIIEENKIKAASCVLPVSDRQDIPSKFGLRHRAAIGISEHSDVKVITISEETGQVHFIEKGNINLIDRNSLESELDDFLS
ncbi:diadenylate cyclase CdaA [Salibacter sp.]|uniref:diadenylate cyclase CdaA n=1 Tax=Salibacter sp. TaxID=2010995 RepID=UPI00287078A7|nr:diadenylate cyclase CdaA [Salibacter sp.]MDR9397913.1 diadenylate cyclase CdaA [Salibacter sp.]MDR9486565.1 diadenylate cyclase CdaA [Salibacter sp.]